MLQSAVSLGLALLFSAEVPQSLSTEESKLWKKIEPSIIYLIRDGQPYASAALIDDRGYFLAHRSVVGAQSIEGRLVSGETFQLAFKATDDPTQLSLLIAENWTAKNTKPAELAEKEDRTTKLFAVLPSGPIRAVYQAGNRIGVLNPSKRAMSLTEIRFEVPSQNVGGAIVFSQTGELLGALNATLVGTQRNGGLDDVAFQKMMDSASGGGGAGRNSNQQVQQMGPGGLTVAYTVGPEALKRVVDGFRSPTHEVFHPAIGIMCKDANGEGALVDSVRNDSQAALAGVKTGDIIVEMAGQEIKSKVDYARVLLRQSVGARITLKVKRGALLMYVPLTVGK